MSAPPPFRLTSPSKLAVHVNANGSVRRIDCRDVTVNAFLGNELEAGPANLYLRRHGARIDWTPLLGPRSPGAVRLGKRSLEVAGEWTGIRFRVSLVLARSAPAWFWHVALENTGPDAQTVDLIHAQDVALANYATLRLNEYYLSQYIDHTPLQHAARGVVLAVRQNLGVRGRHPWLVTGSLRRAESFCTDAIQLHGLATRSGGPPAALAAARLPGVRHQHEHSMAVLQEAPLTLAAGERASLGFFAWLELDHPGASTAADLGFVDRALGLPEAAAPATAPNRARSSPWPRAATLFSHAALLPAAALDAAELTAHFGSDRHAVEEADGQLLSFFGAHGTHIVLPAKERASLRPHGQILRSGDQLVPDEASLTTTVWMGGVFHSMVTQGHVSINRFLSTTHSYLGLFRSHGLRLFVERGAAWHLLGEPSAFEMTPSSARWFYRHEGLLLEVRSWAAVDRHELWLTARVLQGMPCRFLVSNHVALNGDDGSDAVPVQWRRDGQGVVIACRPESDLGRRFPDGTFRIDAAPDTAIEQIGGDELLFADGRSRQQPFVVLITAAGTSLGLRITGQLVASAPAGAAVAQASDAPGDAALAARFWRDMTALEVQAPESAEVSRLAAILPWFAHDAWIHHLAPRGLEQYSGGGWGTRDVCQGPVEFLLSLGRVSPVRELLKQVFRNQNANGDWPQWFMFFQRECHVRAGDSHGDIVFWPLLALAQYLLASGDAAFLDETLPFFHRKGDASARHGSVLAHVERALALINRRVIPGTCLAAYGHGDWNDSLQPADPALADQLCSAWTVTLHHQTVETLAQALRHVGRAAFAAKLDASLVGIRADFQRLLIHDGVVAGYARFRAQVDPALPGNLNPHGGRAGLARPWGRSERDVVHWLHPSDRETGVRYSLLPMIHGILSNLFTHEQAMQHVELIRQHLLAPDGARLFDRPLPYHGGLQRNFQRAETSTFFGREIGLMYMHAHLRWAEAMAHLGDAEAAFHALRVANPIGLRDAVPHARRRQANCYTSSSDAAFADRHEATERYDAVRTGAVDVEGGWRVYSSGAGIAVRLVRERLLGLRLRHASLGIDPVLPRALDGLKARVVLHGRAVALRYRVGPRGHGPIAITCNGRAMALDREPHPYRIGGVVMPLHELHDGENEIEIEMG